MAIDPGLVSSAAALLGALIGGGASLVVAIFTQRNQDRLQRITQEVSKREAVYADFMVRASNLVVEAYVHDQNSIGLSDDIHSLIGMINRMRLFASPDVVKEAEAAFKAIIEISLKPPIALGDLARDSLSKSPDPDRLLKFAEFCRADLNKVRRILA